MSKDKLIVTCAISGIKTSCRKEVYEKRLIKFGDEATLKARYVCNAAKGAIFSGLSVDEIRQNSVAAGIDVSSLAPSNDPVILELVAKYAKPVKKVKAKKEETVVAPVEQA